MFLFKVKCKMRDNIKNCEYDHDVYVVEETAQAAEAWATKTFTYSIDSHDNTVLEAHAVAVNPMEVTTCN